MSNGKHWQHRLVVVIWLIFICKGVFYSLLFPLWEGFDEFAHFAFIQHLATHHELTLPDTPVSREIDRSLELAPLPRPLVTILPSYTDHDTYWKLGPGERLDRQAELQRIPTSARFESGTTALYEGKQAPLYYWLMVPLYDLVQHTTLPTRVFVFRLVNVLLASLIIPIAFFAARRVFSDDGTAPAVCLLMAAMPELYIDASRVGNQVLAMVLYGIFTLLCLRIIGHDVNYLPLAGVVVGLLLLTKAYGLAALPVLVVVALQSVRAAPPRRRALALILCAATFVCAASIATWWYLRNFRLVGAIVWIDGAPDQKMSVSEILSRLPQVQWKAAAHSLIGSHIWVGNWSFLSVRSWMYDFFEYAIALIAVGFVIVLARSFRPGTNSKSPIRASCLLVCLAVYASFFVSIAYHVLMNSINFGVSSSTGWYLFAVILPEGILVVAGLSGFPWGRQMVAALIVCFFVLEMYTVHFLLMPYYSGLISHAPDGGLRSFHVSQLHDIGFAELLTRLQVNRPFFFTNVVLLTVWGVFLAASGSLVYVTAKWLASLPRFAAGPARSDG